MILLRWRIFFFLCLFAITAGWNIKTEDSSLILSEEVWKAEDPVIPPLRTQITDTTSTLTDKQKSGLTSTLVAFETKKGSQIAVLVVGSTGDWTIEEYAVRVFETWKLGRKGIDDGILLVVAIQDHKTKIEVGYGLEGALPDVVCKRIIEEFMIPRFREGDYFQGISDGLDKLIAKIDGEELPEASGKIDGSSSSSANNSEESMLPNKLVTAFIILVVLGKLFGFPFGNGISGGIGALIFVAIGIFWSITFWLLIPGAILLWFFVLANGRSGWSSSSSWGSSSGGGGSWSGGGGSSGGGGASGSW
ncbi:PF04536 family protein [Leptospira weilii serovar Ranarum str. ICFT]|uniref:PF04536 family protein n=1 Tax=Leptospira weilii serovar Ranarum str. ICFT TaxID=1218598 RepID=N1WPL9_9LEPT|nr:TPM domain-containing protein [Leptospira weilii]EMY77768.1 PF04536 family protein [Leptospira weilii serovar Ranarum str. ICFT]